MPDDVSNQGTGFVHKGTLFVIHNGFDVPKMYVYKIPEDYSLGDAEPIKPIGELDGDEFLRCLEEDPSEATQPNVSVAIRGKIDPTGGSKACKYQMGGL